MKSVADDMKDPHVVLKGVAARLVLKVFEERNRQDEKWGWPNSGLASDDLFKKVAILTEETGEVANAVLEHDHANLKVELVQVAAVCVAWLESIEEFGR